MVRSWLIGRLLIRWWQVRRNVHQRRRNWKGCSKTLTMAARKRNTTRNELFGRIPYCADQPDYQSPTSRFDDVRHRDWRWGGGGVDEFGTWCADLCSRAICRFR